MKNNLPLTFLLTYKVTGYIEKEKNLMFQMRTCLHPQIRCQEKLWFLLQSLGTAPWNHFLWMKMVLTQFRMGFIWAARRLGWGGGQKKAPLPKICHTFPAIVKLDSYTLPKEDPKNISITWHTPWVLLASAFFHWKSANFVISRNIDIDSFW